MKTLTADQKQRRERILSSAREQLSKSGYEGINMRELAVMADVSTATLYNLYQSKDTLILAALQDLLAELNERAVSTGATGLERWWRRVEIIADQIVDTPRYAEAMGRMLFTADASDPVVQALLGGALGVHQDELDEMKTAGQLAETIDRDFLARCMASTGWSVILMWMKGYVALHDFKQEYGRNAAYTLIPFLTSEGTNTVKSYLGE